jgi:hypothetical protein
MLPVVLAALVTAVTALGFTNAHWLGFSALGCKLVVDHVLKFPSKEGLLSPNLDEFVKGTYVGEGTSTILGEALTLIASNSFAPPEMKKFMGKTFMFSMSEGKFASSCARVGCYTIEHAFKRVKEGASLEQAGEYLSETLPKQVDSLVLLLESIPPSRVF